MNKGYLMEQLKDSMKRDNKPVKSCLQVLLAEVKNKEIESKKEISEEDITVLIKKQVKQLKETIGLASDGGRDVSEYQTQLEYLSAFLPEEMSEEQILMVIGGNCSGMSNKGQIMKTVMPILKGKADNKAISNAVDKYLK